MDISELNNIRLFLQAFGTVLLAVGGQPLLTSINEPHHNILLPAVVCAVGIVLLVVGFFWPPKTDSESTFLRTLVPVASDSRTYVAMIVILWLCMSIMSILSAAKVNNEILSLRNDQQSITQVLDRFVLPRQVNDEQARVIALFLQSFPPQEVAFDVAQGDEEAGSYRADLQRALEKGGWHTKAINYVVDPPQIGLSISLIQTMAHSQIQADSQHPKADLILREAFGLAGVRVDGWGGTGDNIPEDLIKITVGHRRRDSYALPCVPK
jgi:hypothetical protein